jgi:hypothetical protein
MRWWIRCWKNASRKAAAEADVAKQVHGQVAVASAKMAYQIYKDIFGSARFKNLADKGARAQRLLWASTGTKNPDYPDVKYVEALIGPDTVNTVPVETLDAYRDHGDPKARLEQDVERAGWVLERLPELGISIDKVTQQLEDEGVEKFNKPFDKLMETLKGRSMSKQTRVSHRYTAFYPRKSRDSVPWPSLPWTCAGPGIITPTTCGGSLILLFGNSPKTPGLFSRRSRGTSSSTCWPTRIPQEGRCSCANQTSGGGDARVVSADLRAISPDLCRVFQHGIHVERSFAHLLGRAWQCGRRSTQSRQRSGGASGCRGAALPARLFSPGDRQGRSAAGPFPVQRSRTVADHAVAPTERGMVAVGTRLARLLGLAARLAGPGWQSQALPLGQQ